MEQKKTVWCNIFLIDRERIEKVEHFYRKLRYSQMHSNPGATLKIPILLKGTVIILKCYKHLWKCQLIG